MKNSDKFLWMERELVEVSKKEAKLHVVRTHSNPCHNPPGSPEGGQFCSGDTIGDDFINRLLAKRKDREAILSAINNTPGAKLDEKGLLLTLTRYQKPEQAGERALRTGVFYLPEANSPYRKYYKGHTNTPYGGPEKFEGQSILQRPIFVKAGTGGRGPNIAYDLLEGNGAYAKVRTEILEITRPGWVRTSDLKSASIKDVENILRKYGGDSNLAYDIVEHSTKGNTLAYAIQEHIVASRIRKEGYDSVVSYSKHQGKPHLSEVFDVRAKEYPWKNNWSNNYGDFYREHSRPVKLYKEQTYSNPCHVPAGSPEGGQFCSTEGWNRSKERDKLGRLGKKIVDARTEMAALKSVWEKENPDNAFTLGYELDLNSVSDKEVERAAKQLTEMSQRYMKDVRGLPERFTVWRAGPLNEEVLSVTLERHIASEFAKRHGFEGMFRPYLIERSKVLGDSEGIKGRSQPFMEEELFVRVSDLKESKQSHYVNPCHVPAGSPEGGQFCSTGGANYDVVDLSKLGDAHFSSWKGWRQIMALDALTHLQSSKKSYYGIAFMTKRRAVKSIALLKDYKHYIEIHLLASQKKGEGYGSKMMQEICKIAASKDKGISLVSASSAVDFYKKMGMRETTPFIFVFNKQEAASFAREGFKKTIKSYNIIQGYIERNPCHEPAGSPKGGQFCSGDLSIPIEDTELGFKSAKSLVGAMEYARNVLGVEMANYRGITLSTANMVNKVLTTLKRKHGKMFDEIQVKILPPGMAMSTYGSKKPDGGIHLGLGINYDMFKNSREVARTKVFIDEANYDKFLVARNWDDLVKHEYAHLLSYWGKKYHQAVAMKDELDSYHHSGISRYAESNGMEAIAESYVANTYGIEFPDFVVDLAKRWRIRDINK